VITNGVIAIKISLCVRALFYSTLVENNYSRLLELFSVVQYAQQMKKPENGIDVLAI